MSTTTQLSKSHHARSGRIDYSSTRVMRQRAIAKAKQRATVGTWALGRFIILDDETLSFEGLEQLPGWRIGSTLTKRLQDLWRWNTKQASHQYRKFHPETSHLQIVNLEQLLRRGRVHETTTRQANGDRH